MYISHRLYRQTAMFVEFYKELPEQTSRQAYPPRNANRIKECGKYTHTGTRTDVPMSQGDVSRVPMNLHDQNSSQDVLQIPFTKYSIHV